MDNYKRKWYGNKATVIEHKQEKTVIDYGCPGKGIITSYVLFPGIQMSFLDMDTKGVFPAQSFEKDIISINYCCEGRQESFFSDESVCYLPQMYLRINGTYMIPTSFSFPMNVYKGVSLVVERGAINAETKGMLESFGINLDVIERKFKLKSQWVLIHPNEEIVKKFEFVGSSAEFEIADLRLKALEILRLLMKLDECLDEESLYFTKNQIMQTKAIQEAMIKNPESKKKLADIVKNYDISLSQFQKVFYQIYGDTPYSYLKGYKMNLAANMLRSGNKKISDIALEMGYSNPSKFSEAFRSIYGISPKEYQKTGE